MRPKSPLELQESQQLARVASLSAQIMVALRHPGRGVAESERQLRSWLQADGVEFANDNATAALSLLESYETCRSLPGTDEHSTSCPVGVNGSR